MGSSFPELAKKRIAAGVSANDIAAIAFYLCLAVFLYLPVLGVDNFKTVCAMNAVAAAWGAYFISKRWINNWTPSFFTGAVYGFGPFALSFEMFHPFAGLSFVMIPWLLLPAVYWHKGKTPDTFRFSVRALLTLLPFAGIVLLFWVTAQPWTGPHFLMPKELSMTVKDFVDLIFPLHRSGGIVPFGLYHCSLIFALMGVFVYVKLQRIALLIPIAAGVVLSFWEPVFQISPVVWAAFPILFLSVLCGLGFQAFLFAGKADTKWLLVCAATVSILAAFFAGLAIRIIAIREVFELTMLMYALTAAALWILLALVRLNLRWPWFKWAILTAAITIDLLFSARYLIDKF
ncbi:MAG: hypothetical protein OEV87_02690 [Phycisphaerae bacterium]|nr:hypothetical protein [Phycisphaerae bacterium]